MQSPDRLDMRAANADLADRRIPAGWAAGGDVAGTILGKYRRRQERGPSIGCWETSGGRNFCKVDCKRMLSRDKGGKGKRRGPEIQEKISSRLAQRGARLASAVTKNPSHTAKQNLITIPFPTVLPL